MWRRQWSSWRVSWSLPRGVPGEQRATVSDDIRIAPCREAELPALMRFIGMAGAWLSLWFAVPEYRARNVGTRLILAVRGLGLEVLGAVGANDVSKKALLAWGWGLIRSSSLDRGDRWSTNHRPLFRVR